MDQQQPDPIIENFHFLKIELQQQIKRSMLYLISDESDTTEALIDHNDYMVNLATIIKNHCIKYIYQDQDKLTSHLVRNIYDITHIFSNIGFSIVELLRRAPKHNLIYLNNDGFTENLFNDSLTALDKINFSEGINQQRSGVLISDIAEDMQKNIEKYTAHIVKLISRHNIESDCSSMFYVISMFNNIALNLYHLSEALFSIDQNKVVTIRQFNALKSTLKKVGGNELVDEASFDRIGETKSGCSIIGISTDKTSDEYMAIFKQGKKDKIKEEKKLFETWNNIFPGVAPRVLSYKKSGRSAGILVEYLKGKTFEQILLSRNKNAVDMALDSLFETIEELWEATKTSTDIKKANYILQIERRLPSIFRVHPEYNQHSATFGKFKIHSFNKLLTMCHDIESQTGTPFNVFTHGDFNIDNVIFDADNGQPRFIDLHRSRNTDYLQDISVFMISNYRIKTIDVETRQLIHTVMNRMLSRVIDFSRKHNDNTFEIRLCLGLARSFITSTRFSLDENHADNMFYRGRYLLEKLAYTPEHKLSEFTLPTSVLYD